MTMPAFDERSAEVKEHERRAAIILDGMYQFVALLTPRGEILEVNHAALEGAGHQMQELWGTPFWTARWWQISAQTQEDLRAAIRRAAAGAFIRYEVDIYGEQAGRVPITIDFSLQPILGLSGEIAYLLAEGRNITERKRAEQALRESQAQLAAESEALATLNQVSLRLWQTQSLQAGLEEMLAATIDMLGADMGTLQLLDDTRGVLHIVAQRGFTPDVLDGLHDISAQDDSTGGRALRMGERLVVEDIETDALCAPMRPMIRAAGYRAVQSTPLIGRDGTPLGVISTHFTAVHRPSDYELRRLDLYARQAADFIERKGAEAAKAMLAAIVESSDDAIISKGLDGIITSWNQSAERLFGYTAAEAVGQPITMLIPPERLEEEPKILERLTRGERVDHFETIRMRKDGSRLDLSLTISPVKDAEGHIIGASKVARDITERKAAEQAVREAQWRPRTARRGAHRPRGADAGHHPGRERGPPECGGPAGGRGPPLCLYGLAHRPRISGGGPGCRAVGTYGPLAPRRPRALRGLPAGHAGVECVPGEGLIGRVGARGQPEWCSRCRHRRHLSAPARRPGGRAQHRGGLAHFGGVVEVAGVLEFYATEPLAPNSALLAP